MTTEADVSNPETGSSPLPVFWEGYRSPGRSYDELIGPDGVVRSHVRPFARAFAELGMNELRRRWDEAQDLIRQNGITYNVYGDPRGMDRPWQLDPIPLLIAPEEWSRLERGLIQRAQLLDRILADLYGAQKLLARGSLPGELVFGNPSFLHPCHGLAVPRNRYLHFHAVNLGRAADGSFVALGDRTQAPSGAGYALENRLVLARMVPEVFRDCRVQRLARFFQDVREGLRAITPHNRDHPRVVLLTPGPYNETYFEHAFLAGYLGYALVEGGDLLVRGNRVYLKLLGGLQTVDVILRRVDDDFCDPLELRGDSCLGVPGLLQALRAGNVAIANALGSGLAETPGFLAYLPALCRELLGEDLKLPWAQTWWCGEPKSLRHVLGRLSRMVIKAAISARRFEPIFASRLTSTQLRGLADRIRSRPGDYIAQEEIPLASAPVFTGEGLEPRHTGLRVFLAATETEYVVMPGGLARIASTAESKVVTMQQGGGSKDTWVVGTEPETGFSLLGSPQRPIRLFRTAGDLTSRGADNFYWLGRYVERAESLVRLLRATLVRLTEKSGMTDSPELPALLRLVTRQTQTYPGFCDPERPDLLEKPEGELLGVIFDQKRGGTLAATLGLLQRVAFRVRDRISSDMWRTLRHLMEDLLADLAAAAGFEDEAAGPESASLPDPRGVLSDVLELLDAGVSRLAAFSGLVSENMTRGHSWTFLDMGRRLERSLQMAGLLRGALVVELRPEGQLLETLLEIGDSSMTYRRRYLSTLQTAPVLDLLLADESNPRSLAFQLAALAESIDRLPRDPAVSARTPEQRLALAVLTEIRLADLESLARPDSEGFRIRLEGLLGRVESELPVLSNLIAASYFSHLETSRHLGGGDFRPATPRATPEV
jgi:uncharacterized circularly permuted ATP-grasp superfamily protein/uncharacterized alpha-E superfamily protein